MFGFGKPKWEKLRDRAERTMERQQWVLAHGLFSHALAKAPDAYQWELRERQNQCAEEVYRANVKVAQELLNTDTVSLPGYQDLTNDRIRQIRRPIPTQVSAAMEHLEIALRYAISPGATERVESQLRKIEAATRGGMTSLKGVFFVDDAKAGQWFYRDGDGQIVGPVSLDTVGSLISTGVIDSTTLVQCHDTVGPAELNTTLDGFFHSARTIE